MMAEPMTGELTQDGGVPVDGIRQAYEQLDSGKLLLRGNYVYDTATGQWVPMAVSATGVGAVTIADGADVTQGAIANAAVVADVAGTASGKLRGLVKWAYERMPGSLGQKTKLLSLPVTLASDEDALAVTGAFFQVTQPVSLAVAPSTPLAGW